MVVASRIFAPSAEGRRSYAVLALPFVALALCTVGVLLASPNSHYGLFLAAVPCIAAAIHGIGTTAAIGGMSVALYVALHYQVAEDRTDIWLIKLAFVVVAALTGVLLSRVRVRERQLTQSRALSLALQQGLLPRELPDTNAVEAYRRYLPADSAAGVGGDWFDVIQLSGARVALVVGDVAGHGIHAAAMMGRLRTAVHTLADLDLSPDELLGRLDDLLFRLADEEADRVIGAGCLYVVYDPVLGKCCAARAGHPAPAVVGPAGDVLLPELPGNPPLGLGGGAFESLEFSVREGSVLALFTNGLLDLRHGGADDAIARLAGALPPAGRPLEEICAGIMTALRLDTPAAFDDDITLLLARTRVVAGERVAEWEFPADPRVVSRARALAGAKLADWRLEEAAYPTELVVSELVTNAVRYGCAPITVRLIHDRTLICEVSDASSTSPHLRRAQPMDEGGRGLYLVGRLTERWGTRYTADGKTIWAEQSLRGGTTDLLAVLATEVLD